MLYYFEDFVDTIKSRPAILAVTNDGELKFVTARSPIVREVLDPMLAKGMIEFNDSRTRFNANYCDKELTKDFIDDNFSFYYEPKRKIFAFMQLEF